jgi:hypothetical protein
MIASVPLQSLSVATSKVASEPCGDLVELDDIFTAVTIHEVRQRRDWNEWYVAECSSKLRNASERV